MESCFGVRRERLLVLAVLAPLPVVHSEPTKPAEAPKSFDLGAIDAYVAAQVREQGYAGLSLAIMRDGKVVLAKGYGKRILGEEAPVVPDTPFAVGSVTKQFTCACILLLAEEGKLSVDDPVAKYYPKLTRAGEVSLHDLMAHTSGYSDFYPLDFVDRRLVKPILLDALLAEYAGAKLDFDPSTRWSYSNTGYMVLGGIVEEVSGKPFGQFVKERILDPLGMTHSAVEPGSDWTGRVRGYTSFALGGSSPPCPRPTAGCTPREACGPRPPTWRWDLASWSSES